VGRPASFWFLAADLANRPPESEIINWLLLIETGEACLAVESRQPVIQACPE
jgi:hypothetical protein